VTIRQWTSFVRPSLFAVVGAVNTAFDYAVFWGLISFTPLSPILANVISFSLGAANSFVMNSTITFAGPHTNHCSYKSARRFVAVVFLCLALSTAIVAVGVQIIHPLAAKLISIVVTFTVGYLLNSRVVFHVRFHNHVPSRRSDRGAGAGQDSSDVC
jgi:putative flippase GtrA